jgi:thioredoxin-dependent peroxiredoxin
MSELSIGDVAPVFTLLTHENTEISLKQFLGKFVVLFIYPKDDTSGCTQECIDFTSYQQKLSDAGVILLGLSKDSVKSHQKFIAKHTLNVTLLADEECTVLNAYGVWKEKSMYGKKYMGAERSTFIIDPAGKIAKIYRNVKVPNHAEQVTQDVLAILSSGA